VARSTHGFIWRQPLMLAFIDRLRFLRFHQIELHADGFSFHKE